MIPPQHLKFWPHAEDQEQEISNLSSRFVNWKKSVMVLLNFLDETIKIEKQASKLFKKFQEQIEFSESNLGPSSSGAFKCWQDFAAHQSDTQLNVEQQLKKHVITRLDHLKIEINKKIGVFDKDLYQNWKTVSTQRTSTYNVMQGHENYLVAIQKQNDSINPTINSDPWLMERVLKQQLATMVESENSFQRNMSSIFDNMAHFDAYIIEELKRIFEEFSLIRKNQADVIKVTFNLLRMN